MQIIEENRLLKFEILIRPLANQSCLRNKERERGIPVGRMDSIRCGSVSMVGQALLTSWSASQSASQPYLGPSGLSINFYLICRDRIT